MIKQLLFSALCFFSLLHADNLQGPYNYAIVVDECSNFIEQPSVMWGSLYLATLNADFEYTRINEHQFHDIVFGYKATAEKGYASIFSCKLTRSCIIEFFCQDGSYDYEMFFDTFRKLISLYDAGAVLTSTSAN
jgi:hypothetical protein